MLLHAPDKLKIFHIKNFSVLAFNHDILLNLFKYSWNTRKRMQSFTKNTNFTYYRIQVQDDILRGCNSRCNYTLNQKLILILDVIWDLALYLLSYYKDENCLHKASKAFHFGLYLAEK